MHHRIHRDSDADGPSEGVHAEAAGTQARSQLAGQHARHSSVHLYDGFPDDPVPPLRLRAQVQAHGEAGD